MSLQQENHFRCDLKKSDGERDCEVDFYYDPGGPGKPPPNWTPGIQAALNKAIAVTYLIAPGGHTTFWCCDEHAIQGIERGQHLPALPPKITPATEADLTRAKRGIAAVEDMRTKKEG